MIILKAKHFLNSLKVKILNNKKVIENYFFMTVLQILNSLFYLIIYPFLIRTLGADSYGHYVFAFSISVYFVSLVQFGFDTPALKSISQYPNDKKLHSEVVSTVFFSKLALFFLSLFIFLPLLFIINVFRVNSWLFIICYLQVFSNILFPIWYFQGIQKMRVVTYIQLSLKVISLPILFLFIKHPDDIVKFALITISTGLLGGIIAMIILKYVNFIKLIWIPIGTLKQGFKDAVPFFLSSSMNTVKQQTATILLGSFFSMSDVALYDLAMKIYSVPTTLISSINSALFPKMMTSEWKVVNKVLKIENLIGVFIILGLVLFGKWIIVLMGGERMLGAYPILIILSFSVFTVLTVGGIFNFIFIPRGLYKYVGINQFVALLGFIIFTVIGLIIFFNVLVLPLAFAFAALLEFLYSHLLLNKFKNEFKNNFK
jgi:PST family polysaccharide transporter